MLPRITTIIPAYNQEMYIDAAIASAVKQIGPFDHEILVSSDGSTDKTRDAIRRWQFRYPGLLRDVSPEENLGISGNFRRLFSRSTGAFIAVLEGDDIWTDSEKLAKQLHVALETQNCALVFSKILVRKLPSGDESLLPRQQGLPSMLSGYDFIKDPSMNLIANFSSCLFNGDLIRSVPDRLFEGRFNEIALAFHLEQFGKICFLDEVLSVYHQHAQGVWTGSTREQQLRSGIETREMVLDVAHPKYRGDIIKIIEERYRKPLMELLGELA
ncbi:glycosyltransferase family 2 protein [Agrobacterium tumefaciens]|uniref:glycosyltransferase family 2 protein n=1 Tax=Agrobacterium tumefaciens TaxID=358 RepID=UPI003BA2B64A